METFYTGMVPNEDTGTIMGAVTLPPGTSQERAMEILNRVDSLVAAEPAVDSRTVISGFGFIGGQGPSYGSIIIKLKDWEERSMMQNSDIVVGTLFMRAQKIIKDAQVLFFAPPMIPGYSASSDIELKLEAYKPPKYPCMVVRISLGLIPAFLQAAASISNIYWGKLGLKVVWAELISGRAFNASI